MSEQYKISLGVDVDVSDIQSQINKAESQVDPIKIKIDAETKELTNSIRDALKSLTSSTKNALTLDTSKIESSLNDVNSTIKEIKTSLGTLDSKSGMKSLLSSINQIGGALEKASNKFVELSKNLNILSGKDISLNFGVNLGSSDPVARQAAYGNKARGETLPQLRKQVDSLVKYYNSVYNENANQFEALQRLVSGTKLNTGDFLQRFLFDSGKDSWTSRLSGKGSLASQMQAYQEYIDMFKNAASLKGIDLSSVTSGFSKTADELVRDAQDIQTGAKEMDNAFDKLKQIFGGGNNFNVEGISVQLDSIVANLGEVKVALQGLSSGVSLGGLTSSFDRLSNSIENLLTNAEKVRGVLNNNLNTSVTGNTSTPSTGTSAIKNAQEVGQKVGEVITKSAQQSINIDDVIDEQVLGLMNEFLGVGDKGSDAFNEIKQAVIECRNELNILKNGDYENILDAHGSTEAVDKVTKAIANQMQVVKETIKSHQTLSDYIAEYHNNGYKVHVPDSVRQEYGDDYNRMAKEISSRVFTSGRGEDFESFISQLNGQLGETINLANGAEDAFKQLYDEVIYDRQRRDESNKSDKYLTSVASPEEILEQNGISKEDISNHTREIVDVINLAEQQIAQASTQSTNTVVQNGERKQQEAKETSGVIQDLKTKLETMRVDRSSIDTIIKDMEELGFTATDTSVKMKNGKFDITVNGIDDVGRAITEIRRFDEASQEKISLVERKITQPLAGTDKFVKQQKKAVADLTNQINQLNRSAIDQNASRPIKESGHLDVLESKYNEITSAIQKMGNASSSTFDEEANNVRTLISEYKSLTKEFRNAENVSSKMKGTDFDSGLDIAKNDLEKFKAQAKDFPQITATIKELDKAIENVGDVSSLNKFNDQLRVARSELAKVKSETIAANRKEKVGIDVSGATSRIADIQRISPEIDEFKAKINGAEVTVENLLNDLSKVNTAGDFSVVNRKLRAFEEAAKAAGIAVTETVAKAKSALANDIKLDIELGNFDNEIDAMRVKFNSLSDASNELRLSYNATEDAYRAMMNAANADSGDEVADRERLIKAEKEYAAALEKTNNLIKIQARADKIANDAEKLADKKTALKLDMANYLKDNSRAAKEFGDEIRRLSSLLDNVNLDDIGVNKISRTFKNLTKEIKNAGKDGLTVFDRLKSKAKEYMTYLSAAEVFMWVEQAARAMFDTVLEIDTAMTGLYRVTDLTASEYDALFNNMIDSAKEYGATLNDIINATTDWVRAGFEVDTALGLAEVTTMYQHISDLDYDTAAENLITAYNGFKDELNGAFNGDQVAAVEYIADIFNELDK